MKSSVKSNETMYALHRGKFWTRTAFQAEAEKHVRERGCTCRRPILEYHFASPHALKCTVYVTHTDIAPSLPSGGCMRMVGSTRRSLGDRHPRLMEVRRWRP